MQGNLPGIDSQTDAADAAPVSRRAHGGAVSIALSGVTKRFDDMTALEPVDLTIEGGSFLAIVGPSGCGKSTLLRIIAGLIAPSSGSLTLPGNAVGAFVFQEAALLPWRTVQANAELVMELEGLPRAERAKRARYALSQVGLEGFEEKRPSELSGGMRQRAMIAMAMVAKPDLLIADEPTTALDVTTQAQVLGLMKDLQRETGMALILVTHDLGVVANMAEQVVVMHKGRVMESGSAEAMLKAPAHPYTRQLFDAAPSIPANPGLAPQPPHDDLILEMQAVSKTYVMRSKSGWKGAVMIPACRGVDLELPRGKTLAIVGESGSGKTTAARIALGAELPDPGGEVWFSPHAVGAPVAVHHMDRAARIAFQREAQMVFQDPYSSLSPRMRILDALTEPHRLVEYLHTRPVAPAAERFFLSRCSLESIREFRASLH